MCLSDFRHAPLNVRFIDRRIKKISIGFCGLPDEHFKTADIRPAEHLGRKLQAGPQWIRDQIDHRPYGRQTL